MSDETIQQTAEHFADVEAQLTHTSQSTLDEGDHAIGTVTDVEYTSPSNAPDLVTFTIDINGVDHTACIPAQRLKTADEPPLTYPTIDTVADLAHRRIPVRSLGGNTVAFEPFKSESYIFGERTWKALQNGNFTRDHETGEYTKRGRYKREARARTVLFWISTTCVLFFGLVGMGAVSLLFGLEAGSAVLGILLGVGVLMLFESVKERLVQFLTDLQE